MAEQSKISRRSMLAATSAAAVGAAALPSSLASAQAVGADGGPLNGGAASIASDTIDASAALSALGAGQQSLTYAGVSLIAGGTTAGATTVYLSNPNAGSYTQATGYLGMPVALPVGSLFAGADFVIAGSARAGTVIVERYAPSGAGYVSPSISATVPAGSGPVEVPLAVNEVITADNAYHAYYSGSSATSVIRALRIRYVPPAAGFVAIAPKRVYDSRLNMAPDPNGPLAIGSNRTVSVANGRNSAGVVDLPDVVPANATAIAYTLTVTGTAGAGFLTVNPGGDTTISASAINWSAPGESLANTGVVKLGPNRTITIIAGGVSGSTQVLIDVVGAYVP
jgi:hypothetical protein